MLFPTSINVPVRSREKLLAAIFMLPAAFNMLSDSNQQANDLQEVAAPNTRNRRRQEREMPRRETPAFDSLGVIIQTLDPGPVG